MDTSTREAEIATLKDDPHLKSAERKLMAAILASHGVPADAIALVSILKSAYGGLKEEEKVAVQKVVSILTEVVEEIESMLEEFLCDIKRVIVELRTHNDEIECILERC